MADLRKEKDAQFESELVGHSEQILGQISGAGLIGQIGIKAGPQGSAGGQALGMKGIGPHQSQLIASDGSQVLANQMTRHYPDQSVVNLGDSFNNPMN